MASSLEVAKLVIVSLLYQYWDQINKVLRAYLTIAAAVLILITSIGIYGFLSAAYQETANKAGNVDAQVSLVETKRDNVKEQLAVYNDEKSSINTAVSELRSGLSNNKIQYTNAEGVLITTTSSATRKALEKQLDQAIERQTTLNSKVDGLNEQLFNYETEIVEISTNSELAGELGPLKYLSGLTGVPMDKIINILLLIIIFVFDPLAIALVVAANFAFIQLKPKKNIYGENIEELEDRNTRLEETLDEVLTDIKEEKLNPTIDDKLGDYETEVWEDDHFEWFDPREKQKTALQAYENLMAYLIDIESKLNSIESHTDGVEVRNRLKNDIKGTVDVAKDEVKHYFKNKKDNDDLTINY